MGSYDLKSYPCRRSRQLDWISQSRQPGIFSTSAAMAGYPKVYNLEMDPHEDLVVGGLFGWASGPALKTVEEYLDSVKKISKSTGTEHHAI